MVKVKTSDYAGIHEISLCVVISGKDGYWFVGFNGHIAFGTKDTRGCSEKKTLGQALEAFSIIDRVVYRMLKESGWVNCEQCDLIFPTDQLKSHLVIYQSDKGTPELNNDLICVKCFTSLKTAGRIKEKGNNGPKK